jgi:hypothetical protein
MRRNLSGKELGGMNIIYISIGMIVPNRTEDIYPPIRLSCKIPEPSATQKTTKMFHYLKENIINSTFYEKYCNMKVANYCHIRWKDAFGTSPEPLSISDEIRIGWGAS